MNPLLHPSADAGASSTNSPGARNQSTQSTQHPATRAPRRALSPDEKQQVRTALLLHGSSELIKSGLITDAAYGQLVRGAKSSAMLLDSLGREGLLPLTSNDIL